ncbi:hypothetical protein [Streptomyces gilvosporeus]|nr:hypothetical protein [Streptomyces gilvosporeus]
MRRATSMFKSMAAAVVATVAGCLLVLVLLPSNATPWPSGKADVPPPGAGPARADVMGRGVPAGPEASGHDAAAGRPAHTRRTQPEEEPPSDPPLRGWRIAVNGPAPGLTFRGNGGFSVSWTNNTGREVDVWLTVRHGNRMQRMALVAPRAGAGPTGEALVSLPPVAPGHAYALEVTTDDDIAHAYSTAFSVIA